MPAGEHLCAHIRFHIKAEPLVGVACHGHDCQYTPGGAESNLMIFPSSAQPLDQGEPRLAPHRSRCPAP